MRGNGQSTLHALVTDAAVLISRQRALSANVRDELCELYIGASYAAEAGDAEAVFKFLDEIKRLIT